MGRPTLGRRPVRDVRSWRVAVLTAVALVAAGAAGACTAPATDRTVSPVTSRPAVARTSPRPVASPASRSHAAVLVRHRVVSAVRLATLRPGRWVTTSVNRAGADAVDGRTVALPDGSVVTVYRFRAAATSFVLHAGSQDPGAVAGSPYGSRIIRRERPRLLAAFNGAFKVSSGTGGYRQDGVDVRPLHSGLATFAIDAAGHGAVGIWRHGLPASGARVVSAVQNLEPLIAQGRISPSIGDRFAWGATLGHALAVARSGVGQDPAGNILYAAGMSLTPADLARALLATGARTAMELDINPEWVQADVAARPGGTLHAGVAGQHRPADQFLVGWTRSFFAVMAAG